MTLTNDAKDDFKYTGVDNLEVMLEAKRYNAFLADLVVAHRSGTSAVLDFGAGIGTFSEMVRDRGLNVTCLEIDAYQSDILRGKGFDVVRDSADLSDESFDYVFSLNVFEHIEDHKAAMVECARILRPGGVVFTYVPAFQVLFGDMDRKVEHYRRYTRASLADLAHSADLELLQTRYVDVAGFFASLVYNAISRGSGDINTGSIKVYDRFIFPVSRIADRATQPFIGKNVWSLARKPGPSAPPR